MSEPPPPTDDAPGQPSSHRERVPPHNHEAEESLLGAMLMGLDRTKQALADGVVVSDLHKPLHQWVFQAITEAYDDGAGTVDITVVSERLRAAGRYEASGGSAMLRRLQSSTPASANVGHYAEIVTRLGRWRRGIGWGSRLMEAAYEAPRDDGEAFELVLSVGPDELAPQVREDVEAADFTELMATPPTPSAPWCVPALLRIGEVLVLTGGEGAAKMTVLRQMALGVSHGVHPFTNAPMKRRKVLIVDLQEPLPALRRELGKGSKHLRGRWEEGWLHLVSRRQGIDLLSAHDQRLFEGLLAKYRPELVVMGPLKKTYRPPAGKGIWDDDVVQRLHDRLDHWMMTYGFALCLEGHAGHDRDTWRVKGSSEWYAWPHFGYGLEPVSWHPREVKLIPWRGDRNEDEMPRAWPHALTEEMPANVAHLLGAQTVERKGWMFHANPAAVEEMQRVVAAGDPIDQPTLDMEEPF